MLPKRNWAISVLKVSLTKFFRHPFSDTLNSINSFSGWFQQQRVNTIFTTIKVQLKFGYFITCNGIPVDSTSSFYIFVRRAKCLLICLYMYRISRCIGLHDTKIKLKKKTPKFKPSDNFEEKKNIFNFCQTSSSFKI